MLILCIYRLRVLCVWSMCVFTAWEYCFFSAHLIKAFGNAPVHGHKATSLTSFLCLYLLLLEYWFGVKANITLQSITKKLIEETMNALSKKRRAFWSEADFQFALSQELVLKLDATARIYLERPIYATNQKDKYCVDIWIRIDNKVYPIELKYATKKAEFIDGKDGTIFTSEQVAYDMTRFLYLYDIYRIEHIKSKVAETNLTFGKGFAIILTSDSNYYELRRNPKGTLDESFRIHENNKDFNPMIQWNNQNKKTDHWTKTQTPYNKVFNLQSPISFEWKHFSTLKDIKSGKTMEYKFLVNEIK